MPELSQVHIDTSVGNEKKVKKCPSCGSTLSANEVAANYCDSCDTAVGAGDAAMSSNERKETMNKLSFKLEDTVKFTGDDFVVRSGKVFETGDYQDKGFNLSTEEMDAACTAFQPAPVNINHFPTIFDLGDIGNTKKIWHDGTQLFADVAIDKDIDNYLRKHNIPLTVSAEWNRSTKTLDGLAIEHNPRIQDAVLYVAFSRNNAEFATRALASMHDMSVSHGAECGGKSLFADAAKFMTPEDLKTIQKVHDMCSGDGKHCDLHKSRQDMYSHYSRNTITKPTEARIESRADKEKNTMSKWWDDLKARFSSRGDDNPPTNEEIAQVLIGSEAKQDASQPMFAAATLKPLKAEMTDADKAAFAAQQTELEAIKANFAAQQLLFTQQQETIAAQQKVLEATQATFAAQQKDAQFAADNRKIEEWRTAGKMTAAEADEWRKIAQENAAAFAAAMPVLEARTPLPQFGRGRLNVIDGEDARMALGNANPDTDKLATMTAARMKETGEAHHVAFSKVCTENPALALAHRNALGGKE